MTQTENTRLEKVEDKMGELILEMNRLHQGHEEILQALKGGELSVGKGLVPEVIELRKEVEGLKKFKGYVMAAWFASGMLLSFFKDYLIGLFKG